MMNHFFPVRTQRWRKRRRSLWMCASLALFFAAGCGSEPAISKSDVKVVGELKTAIGAQKTDWLELAAKHLDANRQQGKVTDDEYAAMETIVADARQRHWDEAHAQLTRLIDAQHAP